MSNHVIDPQSRERLWKMPPEGKRVGMRLRIQCPRCPVKTPRLHLEPCHSCIALPDDVGMPKSTVN